MRRYALRDDQWDRIKDFLPGREGHVGGTAAGTARTPVVFMTARANPRGGAFSLARRGRCDSQAVRSDDAGRGRARLPARLAARPLIARRHPAISVILL